MSDVRIVNKPRVEVDFNDDAETVNEDYETAFSAYDSAVEAAKSLGWKSWGVSVDFASAPDQSRTIILERDDEPR